MGSRGSVSLIGCAFIVCLLGGFLAASLAMLDSIDEIEHRQHAYLCLKKQIANTKSYVRKMVPLNVVASVSFYARSSLIPKLAAVAAVTHAKSLHLQTAIHSAYLYTMYHNKYCHPREVVMFLRLAPYAHRGPRLVRNFNGSAKLRRKDWKIYYVHEGIHFLARLQLSSHLSSDLQVEVKELSSWEWSNTSSWFGWESLPFWQPLHIASILPPERDKKI